MHGGVIALSCLSPGAVTGLTHSRRGTTVRDGVKQNLMYLVPELTKQGSQGHHQKMERDHGGIYSSSLGKYVLLKEEKKHEI